MNPYHREIGKLAVRPSFLRAVARGFAKLRSLTPGIGNWVTIFQFVL